MSDDWVLSYDRYEPDQEGLREALCTLGNGVFATRGAAPDSNADDVHYPGTYLAGGYNRLVTEIAGRDVENEDLVNLPNWLPLTYRIGDGPWFRLDEAELLEYRQQLDLRRGELRRAFRWRDSAGRTTCWRERRIVSQADANLAALTVELIAEDWSGEITVRSGLDGAVRNTGVQRYRSLAGDHIDVDRVSQPATDTILLHCQTNQSRLQVAEAARTRIYRQDTLVDAETSCSIDSDNEDQDGQSDDGSDRDSNTVHSGTTSQQIALTLTLNISQQQPVVIEKVVALYSSRSPAISEPGIEACDAVARADRFEALRAANALAWEQIWELCDIDLDVDGHPGTALKLRLHIFHLMQTVSAHTAHLDVGVPARGWHGEAYRGHIFWDELFVFPFLNLRMPALTRALLLYRYRRLDEARRGAAEAGFKGAMYPWQSGSNGREETQRVHLNPKSGRWLPDSSHRQRHVNATIAYNIWQYFQVNDDESFMLSYGAEMMLEIARFWASAASYNDAIDRFEIKGVMGPDEYHTAYPEADPAQGGGIDNNAYTNVIAAWVLSRACDVIDLLPPLQRRQLCARIGLGHDEIEHWHDVACKLRVPFHGDRIISQFDGYEQLAEFDWERYRQHYGDIHRLDRILEAEGDTPNRYKVSKQADVLMLFFLFSADELALLFEQLGYPFDHETIPRNVRYYLARTSHGSTLSQVAHSWVLARSDRPHAWQLFQRALDSDISDIQGGTTAEGIHTGAMAGTVDLLQRCFIGIETREGVLHFDPALPDELRRVRVKLHYRQQLLHIEVDHDCLCICSDTVTTQPITVAYRGHHRRLAPGENYRFRLLKPNRRLRDENTGN